jgi:hypothetical protein
MPLEKIDVRSIIVGHLATLKDCGGQKRSITDLLLFFALPFCVAGASVWFGIQILATAVNALLTAFSIFVGLLFNLLVMVLTFLQTTQGAPDDRLLQVRKQLLREITANLSFAILVALMLVAVAIFSLVRTQKDEEPVRPVEAFILVTGSINFVLTLLMVLRRMYALLMNEFDRHRFHRAA